MKRFVPLYYLAYTVVSLVLSYTSRMLWYISFISVDISGSAIFTLSTFELRLITPTTLFQYHLASLSTIKVHTSPSFPALAVRPARWTYILAVGGES
jgi:hypothetical protein